MSIRQYAVVEAQNLAMGQAGSIFVTGTSNAVTCGAGSGVFVAIQFIEDTVFASASGGLVAETEQLYPDDAGAGTLIDGDGGDNTDGETFPQGMTIYGRWTGFTLASGAIVEYDEINHDLKSLQDRFEECNADGSKVEPKPKPKKEKKD